MTFEQWCRDNNVDRDFARRNYPALEKLWRDGQPLRNAPLPQAKEFDRFREV